MALENNPFGLEKIEDAQELIAREDEGAVQSNMDYYYGDHWQGGEGWSGPPTPDAVSAADYDRIIGEVERGFTSENVVKEIVDRATNAVTGRSPVWDVVPNRVVDEENPVTDEEQVKIKEAKLLLQNWIEQKEFGKYMSMAVRHTLLAGKSTLRLFIPAGFIQDGAAIVDTEKPLDILEIDAPLPLEAGVVVDRNSREKMAVFLGESGEEDTAELSYLLPVATKNGRITEITVLIGKDSETSVELDLGGRLPVHQLEMPRLVTDQVISMQKALNLNLTMMQRNSVLGGFLERVILNGQLPGTYDEFGEFVPSEQPLFGGGSVTQIMGTPIQDAGTGETRYTQADVRYRDPVSPDTFLKAKKELHHMILESCDQLHAEISGDAASSGESRRQALHSFFAYLKVPKSEVDKAGRWMLETALAYAGYLRGQAGQFSDLKVTYDAKLEMGAVPTAEMDLVERLAKTGIMSLETAREKVGIENPEIEARRVEAEKGKMQELSKVNPDGTSKVTGETLPNVDNNDITED